MTDTKRQEKAIAVAREYSQGNIAGLDDVMTRRLVASTVFTESNGGDLAISNKQGYVGRYQAGAGWLADAEFVDRHKLKSAMAGYKSEWAWAQAGGMSKFLQNASNWHDGMSLAKYKQSPEMQDQAFKRNSDAAYRTALKDGVLLESDDQAKVGGFLKARHISGYGGARGVLEGRKPRQDENETTNYDYYNDVANNRDGLDRMIAGTHNIEPKPLAPSAQPAETSMVGAAKVAVIELGANGTQVHQTQQSLVHLGFRDTHGRLLTVDGDFGPHTQQALLAFQHAHHLHPNGVVDARTRDALHHAERFPSLVDPAHPQHTLYAQALHGVRKLPPRTFGNEHEQRNAAASLAVAAHAGGLRKIDHVVLGTNGVNLFAVQGAMEDPAHRRVHVDRVQAAAQTVEHGTLALQQGLSMQQQQPANSHPLMQPVMEQRGVVMGIRP
jgi:hypothetical protein